MEKVSRNAVVKSLEGEWDEYLDRLTRLSPAEKGQFLQKQGYQSTVDFLAHIVGWWQECMRIIRAVQQEPAYKPDDVSVDEYNKKLIAENRCKSEEEIIGLSKEVKSSLKSLVAELPDSAIENETINTYMFWCITNHIEEHKMM